MLKKPNARNAELVYSKAKTAHGVLLQKLFKGRFHILLSSMTLFFAKTAHYQSQGGKCRLATLKLHVQVVVTHLADLRLKL